MCDWTTPLSAASLKGPRSAKRLVSIGIDGSVKHAKNSDDVSVLCQALAARSTCGHEALLCAVTRMVELAMVNGFKQDHVGGCICIYIPVVDLLWREEVKET